MPRNLQVVNVPVPVLTDLRRRRHVTHYTATAFGSQPSAVSSCTLFALTADSRQLMAES
jgi:hypothetical protein